MLLPLVFALLHSAAFGCMKVQPGNGGIPAGEISEKLDMGNLLFGAYSQSTLYCIFTCRLNKIFQVVRCSMLGATKPVQLCSEDSEN